MTWWVWCPSTRNGKWLLCPEQAGGLVWGPSRPLEAPVAPVCGVGNVVCFHSSEFCLPGLPAPVRTLGLLGLRTREPDTCSCCTAAGSGLCLQGPHSQRGEGWLVGSREPMHPSQTPGRGRGGGWKERLLDCRGEAGGSELGTGAKLPHVPWAVSSGQSERAKAGGEVGDLGGPW